MIVSKRLVVIDTNVLVSALLAAGGFPGQILDLVKNGSVRTGYCDAVLAEYGDVLSRPKFNFRAKDVSDALAGIVRAGIPVNAEQSTVPMPDESDRKFYDVAKSSGAILITGNRKHYPDEPHILAPADFVREYCP